jgi:glycerol-3-phosphate O-acyltransferase
MRRYATENDVDFREPNDTARRALVAALGEHLMRAISSIIPVLPVSLVATVLLRAQGQPLAEIELKSRCYAMVQALEACGAHIHVPRGDLDYAFGVGLRMLMLRRIVVEDARGYCVASDEEPILAYYANAIAPLVDKL